MKIKVWQVAIDEDMNGTHAEVFGSEEEMTTWLWDWFAKMNGTARTAEELKAHFGNNPSEAFDHVAHPLTTASWGEEIIEIPDPYPPMAEALRSALSFFEVCGDDEDTKALADKLRAALDGPKPEAVKPPRIGITVEGGLVQSVFSDAPDRCPVVYIIDHDTEGADDDELTELPEYGTRAIVHEWAPDAGESAEWFDALAAAEPGAIDDREQEQS